MERRRIVYCYTLVLLLLAVALLIQAGQAGVDGCLDCWGGVLGFQRLFLAVAGIGSLACFLRFADQIVGLPVSAEGRLLGALVVVPIVLADFTAPIPGLECFALMAVGGALLLDRRGHAGLSAVVFALAAACRLELIVFPLWIWISRLSLRRRQGKTGHLVVGLGLLAGAFYLGRQPLVDAHGVDSWTLKRQVFALMGEAPGEVVRWAVFIALLVILAVVLLAAARRLSPGPSKALQPREMAGLCFLALLAAPFDGSGAPVLLMPLCMISYESGRGSCRARLRRFAPLVCCLAVVLSWYLLKHRFPLLDALPGLESCSPLLVAGLLLLIAPLHARSHPEAGDDPGCSA